MGDENFSLEGLTVEEIKRAMAILQAKRAKAYAELKKLDADIDEVKFVADKLPFKIVCPEKNKLKELKKSAHTLTCIFMRLRKCSKQASGRLKTDKEMTNLDKVLEVNYG